MDINPSFEAANDYHLSIGSPCVDAGNNGAAMGSTDLDGLPRIVNGAVDMGAYEYLWPDTDEDGMPDRFEWQSIGNRTNLMTGADQDGDGLDNLDEYFAGTSASNPASCFRFETIATQNTNDMAISWQSATGKRYRFYRSTNLLLEPQPFLTNILATPPMNTVTDRTATGRGPWFYRVILE